MMRRFLLIHDDFGIFVGHGMGMCFFSHVESAGQTTAVTFATEDDAKQFVTEHLISLKDKCRYYSIRCVAEHASIDEIVSAGLEPLLGDMRSNLIYDNPTVTTQRLN